MLYYHKCNDCLTPFSSGERRVDVCDCEGSVTFMGMVQGDKYVLAVNKPACDGRCTHAHGPHCDCQCGGVNHGTGRVVQTVIKEGKVHVVKPDSDIYDEMVRGYRFREFRDYAERIYAAYSSTMPKWDYKVRSMRSNLDKTLSLKVYDRREKALTEFIIKNKSLITATPTKED
jgi:hypothetical protein